MPYVYRPVRGHVLSVAEKEFIEAAVAQGASNRRLIFSEILPNVISVVIVLMPLMVATTILTEAALSFLGVGVQPPNASWGTIISDGNQLLYTRPWVAIAPGIMIVLTVLALNVLGDGIRDALDPARQAPSRGRDALAPFIIRRLLWTALVMFVITLLVFLIFFETPGVDPARQIAGRNPSASALTEIRHQFGLDRPVPIRYLIMMKKLFISRDLVSYSNQGQSVVPEIVAAMPATLSLVFGAAVIWVVLAILMGVGRRGAQGHAVGPVAHDPRPDRDLDAGLLAGRGHEPPDPAPVPRLVPLRVGARPSATRRSRRIR